MISQDEANLIGGSIEDAARKLNQLIGHAATRGLIVQAGVTEVRLFSPHAATPFVDVNVRVRIEDLDPPPSAEGDGPELEPALIHYSDVADVTKAGPKKA